jgi:hypothetical protein
MLVGALDVISMKLLVGLRGWRLDEVHVFVEKVRTDFKDCSIRAYLAGRISKFPSKGFH